MFQYLKVLRYVIKPEQCSDSKAVRKMSVISATAILL